MIHFPWEEMQSPLFNGLLLLLGKKKSLSYRCGVGNGELFNERHSFFRIWAFSGRGQQFHVFLACFTQYGISYPIGVPIVSAALHPVQTYGCRLHGRWEPPPLDCTRLGLDSATGSLGQYEKHGCSAFSGKITLGALCGEGALFSWLNQSGVEFLSC